MREQTKRVRQKKERETEREETHEKHPGIPAQKVGMLLYELSNEREVLEDGI